MWGSMFIVTINDLHLNASTHISSSASQPDVAKLVSAYNNSQKITWDLTQGTAYM